MISLRIQSIALLLTLIKYASSLGQDKSIMELGKQLDSFMDQVAEAHPDTHWQYKDTRMFRRIMSNQTSVRRLEGIQMRNIPGLDAIPGIAGILGGLMSGEPPCPLEVMALAIKLASPPPPPPTEDGHPCSWMTTTTLLPAPSSPTQFLQCRPATADMIKMPIPNIPGLPPLPIPGLSVQSLAGGIITADMLPPLPYMDHCGAYLTHDCPNRLFFNADEEACSTAPGGGGLGAIGGLAGMAMGG